MRRTWFQGGSFFAAAGALLVLGAVNCLSIRAADLRIRPPTFPTTNRIRLELVGLAPGQRAQLQAIPRLTSPAEEFGPVILGARGESVFEIPVPWSEEGYFRAVALDSEPGASPLELQIPTALQRVAAGQRLRLAPLGALVAAGVDTLENGWIEVTTVVPDMNAGQLALTTSDRIQISSDAWARVNGVEVARVESVPSRLRLQLGRGATAAAVTELIRQVEYHPLRTGSDSRMHLLQWRMQDASGRRSLPRVQSVEWTEACDEPLDVALVLDRTSSISPSDFDLLRQAAVRFVEQLGLSGGLRRAAVVSFCSSAHLHVSLTSEAERLKSAIGGLQRSAHLDGKLCDGTVIASGIREGLQALDEPSHRRLIILLTDGWESSTTATRDTVRGLTIAAAADARSQQVQLLIYALGAGPDHAHLQRLVARSEDLIPASDYASLTAMLGALGREFCDPVQPLPLVSAGEDLRVVVPRVVALQGVCSNCSSSAQARWEVLSGPGAVGFSARALHSEASFSEPGIYQLRLTVSEGLFRGSDEIQVVATGSNQPPRVSAQFEQLTGFEGILSAEAIDDGLDDQGFRSGLPLRFQWAEVSGPGPVQFERPHQPQTFLAFSVPGEYQVKLEVHDAGGRSTSQIVPVHVVASSAWEFYPSTGYASASLGGLRDRGQGTLSLRGVQGPVRRAFLYWHGPVDSWHSDANSRIRFAGRWIQGVSLGLSHDDGWTYRQSHPYAVAHSYRADVTALVGGDGEYPVSELVKTAQFNVNGLSLLVLFDQPEPALRRDVRLWSGNESNGGFAPAANDEVKAMAVYPDGRVLMGGAFTEAGGVRRNRLARVLPDGQLDVSFDAGAGPSGLVRSVALQADGTVWVGGSFTHFDGKPTGGLVRLSSSGTPLDQQSPSVATHQEVNDLLMRGDEVWVAGSDGIQHWDLQGKLVASMAPGATVRVVRSASDGALWFGGDQPGPGNQRVGWLARWPRSGTLEIIPAVVDGSIAALAEAPEGGWYVGGDFLQWDGATRHGVARLKSSGALDLDWIPESLNALPGQEVSALHVQAPGPEQAWDTSVLVVGGRLWLQNGEGEQAVALCRLVDGSTDNDPFEPWMRDDPDRVLVIAPSGDQGELWLGGHFQKEQQTNRARVDQGGRLLLQNSGDQGWLLPLEIGADPGSVLLELHVSDGQPCSSCLGQPGGDFLDPTLVLNDQPWRTPFAQTLCGVEQDQLFAGLSTPSISDQCWKGTGLWDVLRLPLSGVEWKGRSGVLRTEYFGPSSQEDFVTLVAAALISPPGISEASPVHQGLALPHDDQFHLLRSQGNQRLTVMANDRVPATARIESISVPNPQIGRVRIASDATSLILEPDLHSEQEVLDTFSYVVGWGAGLVATGYVTVSLTGPAPDLLPEQGSSTPLKLTSGPSFFRGPRHFSQTFVYETSGTERLDLAILDPEFSAHLYIRDSDGDLTASAWHESEPFGAFLPLVTPVYLSYEVPRPGRYTIEVAGNQPGEGGEYLLRVGKDRPDRPFLGLRVNHLEVTEEFELGWIPPTESVIEVEWDNLSSHLLEGFRFEAYCDHPAIDVLLAAPDIGDLRAGETRRWLCRIRRPAVLEAGTAALILRGWVEGRIVHRSVGRLYFGPGSAGLHVQAHSRDRASFELEAIGLTGDPAAPVTFVIESGRWQTTLRAEGTTTVWSNAAPGLYWVWAHTESAASLRIPLQVAPPKPLGEARSDSFQVGVGSVSNRLALLKNDEGIARLVSVGPASLGVVVLRPDGEVEYSPAAGVSGFDRFAYVAEDSAGTPVSAEVEVEVADPAIRWLEPADGSRHLLGSVVPIRLQVDSTRAAIVQIRLFADGQRIPSGEGPILEWSWTPSRAGFVVLQGEAMDEQGIWWNLPAVRIGVGTADDRAPVALITSPAPGDLIETDRLEVRGTALDPDQDSSYRLVLQRATGEWVQEWSGVGPVAGGVLGELDMTRLRNGSYDLTLVTLGGIQTIQHTVRFILQSDAKIGQLYFTETDLELPTAGLPLVLSRTYDSLNPGGGDFGPGWTLSLYDLQVEIDEDRTLLVDPDTEARHEVRVGGGRDISLTLPGGMRTTFRHSLRPGPNGGGVPCFCYEARWEAPPGFPITLTAIGNRELRFIPFQQDIPPFWVDAGPGTPMENYDFRGWVLTNVDGLVLQIVRPRVGSLTLESDSALGRSVEVYGRPVLQSMQSPTGERVEISEDSSLRIEHRDRNHFRTRSLLLKRGAHGFITEAFDSASMLSSGDLRPGALPLLRYEYDESTGNLVAVRRLQDRQTGRYSVRSYSYTNRFFPHYLTELRDERGVAVLRPGYDSDGRLISVADATEGRALLKHELARRREESVDPLGHRTIHDYDALGNVIQTVDASGRITRRAFGANHRLLAETNAWGTEGESWMIRTYDSDGRLSTQASPQGTNRFLFDSSDRLIFQQDPLGVIMTNTFDSQGRLERSARIAGGTVQATSHRYDDAGNLVESRDTTGLITRYSYDTAGQMIHQTLLSAEGVLLDSTEFSYDGNGNRLTESTLRRVVGGALDTVTRSLEYDVWNRVVQTTDALGGVRQTRFDELGRVVAEADELGRWTRYYYDSRGLLVQTVYPFDDQTPRVVSRTFYDALGRPVYVQQASVLPMSESETNSVVRSSGNYSVYDALGRVVRTGKCRDLSIRIGLDSRGITAAELVEDPEILTVLETGYDVAGRRSWVRDGNGVTTAYGFDAAGRRIAVTNAWDTPRQVVHRSLYAASGLLSASIDPADNRTEYEYDAWGRRVATRMPEVGGHRSSTWVAYDGAGHQVFSTNEVGIVTGFGYDVLGRLTSVTNALGSSNQTVTVYGFDEAGNQISQTDALGRTTRYAYDALGRRVMRELPGGEREFMSYDAVGNLVLRTNFNGRVIEQRFDARDRLWRKVERLATGEDLLAEFTFTATGHRATQVDPSGATTYTYDDLDRLQVRDKPGYGRLEYGYLPGGQVARTVVEMSSKRWEVRYDYDELGRLTGASIPEFGVGATYAYDLAGMLIETRYANGLTNSYRYDSRNRLQQLSWGREGEEYARFDYQVNEAGQRVQLEESFPKVGFPLRTYRWEYDDLQRLTRETIGGLGAASYHYDAVGNRLRRESSLPGIPSSRMNYDRNDRMDPDDDPTNSNPDYDGAGNTLRGEYQGRQYEDRYDAENRLIERVYRVQ
jgi:YD repeat-containing protein